MSYQFAFFILTFIIVQNTLAQKSKYWGQLTPGNYSVGFQDTVLFNSNEEYTLGNYTGPKPYFTNIWFPLKSKSGKQIEYSEYVKLDRIKGLELLTDSIQAIQHESFIYWGITYNLDSWDHEELDETKIALTNKILKEPLAVFKTSKFPKSRYPTIIYHHGSGGISFENAVLFEFLASHGYVIISADYHWPNLRGRLYTQKSDRCLEDVGFVVSFAETLPFTDTKNLTYIGHSWGGGVALRLNQKGFKPFKQYIIFDSTIEGAGLAEMKDIYPHFDSLFRHHPYDFKTKTTVITSRGSYYHGDEKIFQPSPEFIPFQFLDHRAFTFLTLKEILNHGSYASVEVMRSVFNEELPQKDKITINEQFLTYQYLVTLTKELLDYGAPKSDNFFIYDQTKVKEDFDVFLYKFSTDTTFQRSRVKFPIEFMYWIDPSNPFMGETRKNLTLKDWSHESLLLKESNKSQIYDNHAGKLSDSNERLVQMNGIDNGMDLKYFFSLIDNKWYLTYKVDFGK